MLSQTTYIVKDSFVTVPFVDIVLPYSEIFTNNSDFELSTLVKDKLEQKLLEELSSIAEVTLQTELDDFNLNSTSSYDEFIDQMNLVLTDKYPVLDRILKIKAKNYLKHIRNIITRFRLDIQYIELTFNLKNVKIVDIDVSLGDGHNGEGTALVYLSDGTKLIYKPRNISITNSYNSFINWVNCKLKIDLKLFKALDFNDYGWIEFVNSEKINSDKDLQEYYYKAGVLLAVTLLLGSKDCHHENVISSGKNPIMIDHETIIQPFFNDQSFRIWDVQHKIPFYSVLESFLIGNPDKGVPLDVIGYGVNGNIEVADVEKVVINANTINSKRIVRFTSRKIVSRNVPEFKGKFVFVNNYKDYFFDGFSNAYDLFLHSKDELRSDHSPLEFFKNKEVRFVWRPTFVYFKILKYMRAPSFMLSYEQYVLKLRYLLSKAFQGDNMEKYKFILDFEMEQMLNGDIPIFSLQSIDNFLEGDKSLKLFEHNCLQNIIHRINLLSATHKEEQLGYISKWLTM